MSLTTPSRQARPEAASLEVPVLEIGWRPGDGAEALLSREWLVTNGLGGYASGTVLGTNTRRYHGFFIPDIPAPHGRTVMVSFLEETFGEGTRLAGAERAGSGPVPQAGTAPGGGRVEGDAAVALRGFRLEGQTPVWTFAAEGRVLEKRVIMPYGQNTAYAEYRLLEGPPAVMHVRPYVSFRMHDGPLGHPPGWPFTVRIARGRLDVQAFDGVPAVKLAASPKGVFVAEEKVIEDAFYRMEKARGDDHVERLFSPGFFRVEVSAGRRATFCATVEDWGALEPDITRVFEAESQRLRHLLALAPAAARSGVGARLILAADQFITRPGTRIEESAMSAAAGEQAFTVIAGYHWFTDWGRDTMISLEGLTLWTGRHREAGAILRTFSRYVQDGLLPNLFPEGERTALYHTADATLWYFHALDRYLSHTSDKETLERLFPVLRTIIDHHVRGTRFGISVDPADGLLRAGAAGLQLTWMDAKVEDWVVTPRRGKPVEIQGLWHNALRLMAEWARLFGIPPSSYEELAERTRESFNKRFWLEEKRHLLDVADGESGDDARLRPNQLFALSLRHPVLAPERWRPVVDTVTERLLTPYGLRTLDPGDPEYRPLYEGNRRARDAAYHQGMVWTWLIGHYLDARRRAYPAEAHDAHLEKIVEHLGHAGVGTVSEIFDAEPPHTPRGCVAQAWSVAETFRALMEERRRSDEDLRATPTRVSAESD